MKRDEDKSNYHNFKKWSNNSENNFNYTISISSIPIITISKKVIYKLFSKIRYIVELLNYRIYPSTPTLETMKISLLVIVMRSLSLT